MSQSSIVMPVAGPKTAATMFGLVNAAFQAVQSGNSGSSAPANGPSSLPMTYQVWVDTTSNPSVVKMYDGANWVVVGKLDTSAHTWTPSYHGTDLGTAATATTGASAHTLGFLDVANTWSALQTFNNGAAITGGTAAALTSFGIRSTGAAFDVKLASAEVLTATRTVTWVLGDAAHTITLGAGNPTLTGVNTGDQTITLTSDVTGSGTGSFATTIAANAVTNAKAAQMAAFTIKGNVTGSLGNASDFTIGGLTHKASPASTDLLLIQDQAASGALKYSAISEVVGALASGVSSIAGNTGAFTLGNGLTNSTNVLSVDASFLQGFLSGLVLSNDGGTPNSVLDVAAGVAVDGGNAAFIKIGAFTKSTAGAWASGSGGNGMGNGLTIANSTWYHVILANNGGTPDIYFDTSATGANRPGAISDTKVRRIGSFKTDVSAHIVKFAQLGDVFLWDTPSSQSITTSTTASLKNMNTPAGVKTQPLFDMLSSVTGANNYFSSPDTADVAASNTTGQLRFGSASSGIVGPTVWTDTSSQLRYRSDDNTGGTQTLNTHGWVDRRGRDG